MDFSLDYVDYDSVTEYKFPLFDLAYEQFISNKNINKKHKSAFNDFCDKNDSWLNDFALFVTIKSQHGGVVWTQWPELLKKREASALNDFNKAHTKDITKVKFLQYLFFLQWDQLKNIVCRRVYI